MQPPIQEQLHLAGYRLLEIHNRGPVGTRCVLEPIDHGPLCLADLVYVSHSESLRYLCNNVDAFRGVVDHPLIVKPLDAGWLREDVYFQVLDVDANAKTIGEVWPPQIFNNYRFYMVASRVVAALIHMRERGAIHGALAPSTILLDNERLRLAELWWAHNIEELPYHDSLKSCTRESWPISLLPYLPPEVLAGSPPGPESDIYELGATLFYSLTARNHRDVRVTRNADEYRNALLNAPVIPLKSLRPDLDDSIVALVHYMLEDDLDSRPDISLVEHLVGLACQPENPIQAHSIEDRAGDRHSARLKTSRSVQFDCKVSCLLGAGGMGMVDCGHLVPVTDAWLERGTVGLTITHPVTGAAARYRVISVVQVAWGTLALIAPEAKVLPGQPEKTLVKVIAHRMLETLKPADFAKAMLEISAYTPDDRVAQVDAQRVFGQLMEIGSRDQLTLSANSMLTNRLVVGQTTIAPGTTLSLSERWQDHGLHLVVIADHDVGEQSVFHLRWLVNCEHRRYAILRSSAPQTAATESAPWRLVRILDEGNIRTVSDEEMAHVLPDCEATMNCYANGHAVEIELALGPFISAP